MVTLACQHTIKMVVMWNDRLVSSFEQFEWLDLAHVHACSFFSTVNCGVKLPQHIKTLLKPDNSYNNMITRGNRKERRKTK